MTAPMAPLTHETGDTGYSGDKVRQEPEFRRVSAAGCVPGSARERGHEPGTGR
jgi:hypothetical protein